MIGSSHQILVGDQSKKNEMCGARSTYEEEDRCIRGFGGET
jgi:hypothetical protein